jgi:hypothetical protein
MTAGGVRTTAMGLAPQVNVSTRSRRTRDDILRLRAALYDIVAAGKPMTVRQVFYRAVFAGLIGKTEAEYKTTVGRLLVALRQDGGLPYDWIADGTRWMRKPSTFSSLDAAVERWQTSFRRDLWDTQDTYVEIWLEKEALAGVLYPVTSELDVPLMVTRGYPSLSYLFEAGECIAAEDRPVWIYYLGDHDPSGVDIARNVEARLREFAPNAHLTFERIAVTQEQIRGFGLPTRPTKTTDSRIKSWKGGGSVEVDALEPDVLRDLVKSTILRHVDQAALAVTRVTEQSERELLGRVTSRVRRGRSR